MLDLFEDHIRKHQLCTPGEKILLAISGGLDSMVMLNLFRIAGYDLHVAHCNFNLRGTESGRDEIFVREQCASLSIPFSSKLFDTNNYAIENGLSIQMAARELRYEWFAELLGMHDLMKVATAHHLNDSVETVVFNLTNGRGIDGMLGVSVKNDSIIRPMLFASKRQLEKYAAEMGIPWREDSSNLTNHYARNLIRSEVIPFLEQINPNLTETIHRTFFKNRGILELAESGRKQFEANYVRIDSNKTTILKSGLEAFREPAPVLYEFIKSFGFTVEQCEDIVDTLGRSSGKKFLSPSHLLVVDRKELVIAIRDDAIEGAVQVSREQDNLHLGDMDLALEWTTDLTKLNEPNCVSVDADKVAFPLTWRVWTQGDAFYPLGMESRKKVSDLLIDRKVSLIQKAKTTVLVSGEEIMWVLGHQVSEHFKITPGTRRAIRFRVSPHFI